MLGSFFKNRCIISRLCNLFVIHFKIIKNIFKFFVGNSNLISIFAYRFTLTKTQNEFTLKRKDQCKVGKE